MDKKIIIVNGSPRKQALTYNLIQLFCEKIKELRNAPSNEETEMIVVTEIIQISDYQIQPCTGCDSCLRKPYQCPLSKSDDMLKIENKLKEADAIILATPSYFANMTGQMKILLDRTRPLKMNKYQLKNKFFTPIITSGLRAGGINSVQDVLIQYALIQGMIVVGALGHPVLMANLPTESSQKLELTSFRKHTEISEVSKTNINALAERYWEILQNH